MAIRCCIILLLACACVYAEEPEASLPPPENNFKGRPRWLSIGNNVYHEGDEEKREQETLEFEPRLHWFMAFSKKVSPERYAKWLNELNEEHASVQQGPEDCYIPQRLKQPKKLADLPLKQDGAELSFSIAPGDATTVKFNLVLSASERAVYREWEHRWTNVLPLLFAIYVDGKALQMPDSGGGGKSGGVNHVGVLVPSGKERKWNLSVDVKSFAALLPDQKPHQIAIVAAFSERQHGELWLVGGDSLSRLVFEHQQILIRSEPVVLHWNGTAFKFPERIDK